MKHLDDFVPGQVFHFRCGPVSSDEIKAFAHRWDPQRLHTDEDYATVKHGSLIASGFQTLLEVFRPVLSELMIDVANIGGMGFDNVRWLQPLRPDEPLDVEMTVNSVTPSKSKPDRGVMNYTVSAKNPKGEVIFTTATSVMIQRKIK